MAQFYNIEWVSPANGEPDQYGNHWYTIKIDGSNVAMLAKNEPTVGQRYGEITSETSKAGKAYRRFRAQQVPDGVQPISNSLPSAGTAIAGNAIEILALLKDNNRILRKLIGEEEVVEPAKEAPKVVDYSPSDNINLDDIPF